MRMNAHVTENHLKSYKEYYNSIKMIKKEGEGSSQGTCIKDPWAKTMGQGFECGGWAGQGRVMGENEDNCN